MTTSFKCVLTSVLLVHTLLLQRVKISSAAVPTKLWKMNTNFNNMDNWIGFDGTNCSRNIFSFPVDMERTVISFPANASIAAQSILLPTNGYFIFQNGSTTLYNLKQDSCSGVELKFARTERADWFDANNWLVNSTSVLDLKAIPHVERVPCQYDAVQFAGDSSFHLTIPSNVAVAKFFLGTIELAYTDVAFIMSTRTGEVQFLKGAETVFDLTLKEWQDSEEFICNNYQPDTKNMICSKTNCNGNGDGDDENKCSNPISPEGFCCPICGIHVRAQHTGNLRLIPVRTKLESLVVKSAGERSQVGVYVTRSAPKFVNVIFIVKGNAWKQRRKDVTGIVEQFVTFLKQDQQVVSTKLTHSFGSEWNPSGSNDQLQSSDGLSSGETILIILVVLICAALLLVYVWNKRGYPPVTLDSILSRVPSFPSMATVREGLNFASAPLRGSVAFARFSNERISNIDIGQRAAAGATIERTEPVDIETKPIQSPVLDVDSASGLGFTNVTYDLIGIGDSGSQAEDTSNATAAAAQSKLGAIKEAPTKEETEHVYDLVDVSDDPVHRPILDSKGQTKGDSEE